MTKSEEEQISSQAAEWFAYFLEDNNQETELANFKAWIQADTRHADAYSRLERLWHKAGIVPDISTKQVSRRNFLKYSTTSLAVIFAGASAYHFSFNRADYKSATGKIETAYLTDGTKIQLSTGSSVSIHFTDRQRIVKLITGEAFFEVSQDSARPFMVIAQDVSITALGTAFSVKLKQNEVNVVVAEHSVRVDANGRSVQVNQGFEVDASYTDIGLPELVDLETRLSWIHGRLVYISRPLGEVIEELQNWRKGRIIITDSTLAQRPVTLVVNLSRVDQLTQTLAEALPVRVESWSPWLTFIRPL
ncbi:FecR family protein [Brucellaceae bacterium C25G]